MTGRPGVKLVGTVSHRGPIVERPEGLLIRVSTHFYNTEDEIDRIGTAVESLCPPSLTN